MTGQRTFLSAERDIDKSGWPAGPWHSEPDRVHWVDAETGLDCLIVRNSVIGNLCGYVGVPPGHPLHGTGYSDVDPEPDVHGGLTYSDFCDVGGRICHVPRSGRPADVWWFGFDCTHGYDLCPGVAMGSLRTGTYRSIEYAAEQCEELAAQLTEKRRRAAEEER